MPLMSRTLQIRRQSVRAMFAVTLLCFGLPTANNVRAARPADLLKQYCFDCHDHATREAGLDLEAIAREPHFDAALIFENLATAKMPPADAEQPSTEEKRLLLQWLAESQKTAPPQLFRRLSRYEFVHSLNDLLGTRLKLAEMIPDDRGTRAFDSDRHIQLSKEVLGTYFAVADTMLDSAFPMDGFPRERAWVANKLKDSHETYKIYVRDHNEGHLFSWTRANNGNSYSFFYDNFDPPVAGWYQLTIDAAKVGDFPDDVSIQVHAGKYYYADDRPQPQRLLDVISVGNHELRSFTTRVYLRPGENVSVHCYSEHTFRRRDPQQGAYIRQLKVRGPVHDQWPPRSYQTVFAELPINAPARVTSDSGESSPTDKVVVSTHSPEDMKKVIRRFSERAFASKLSEKELEPYYRVGRRKLSEGDDFAQATRTAIKMILCSPRFLMVPGEHTTPAHSITSDLARILWLSVPDDQLVQFANEHRVETSISPSVEELRKQIHRMLADTRSDRMIESFCDQWLNLRSWNKVTPSLKLYPRYDDLLDHYLPIETRLFLASLIRDNMPVSHLIDSDYTFLNQRLAKHYGIEGVIGQEMRKVSFTPDVPRGGLLTMGSVLKVTTDGFDTSPILRGAWISKNIVGMPISPPPPSVEAIEPAHDSTATTLRERIEKHKTETVCYSCHKNIDPYGFALEQFDATGQWRTNYRVLEPHQGTFQFRLQGYYRLGASVDPSGEINDRQFDDVLGLKNYLLTNSHKVEYNFAKNFFEYANGYKPSLHQRVALLDMLKGEDCRMRDLITEILVYSLVGDSQ